MWRQPDMLKLARIQIVVIVIFVLVKMVRPFFLEQSNNEWIHILVLSFPNLAEGIIGVLTSTILLLVLRRSLNTEFLTNSALYLIAFSFSAVYVLLQEFKVHNLGGNNVYDFNDVVFSILGLSIGAGIIWKVKPTLKENISHDPTN